jgi:CheY-like chemotaxis protein
VITNRKGIIVWIDHAPAKHFEAPDHRHNLWNCLFGEQGRLVHALLDLDVRLVASADQAAAALPEWRAERTAGSDVICVMDLKLPMGADGPASTQFGRELGRMLREARIPTILLTANSEAAKELSAAGLGGVPFYLKTGPHHWPSELANHVLGRFAGQLHWLNLKSLTELVDTTGLGLDLSKDLDSLFPYFGPFREFAQRWLDRERAELPPIVAFRTPNQHSARFESQCSLVVLASQLSRLASSHRVAVRYVRLADTSRQSTLALLEDRSSMIVVRLPTCTEPEGLSALLEAMFRGRHTRRTFILVPSDGEGEAVLELLQQFGVPLLDQLPDAPWEDPAERLELVRRSAAVCLQLVLAPGRSEEDGDKDPLAFWFQHPELLVHPLDWTILVSSEEAREAISDPPELLEAFQRCIGQMPQLPRLRTTVRHLEPPNLEDLLQVCRAVEALGAYSTQNGRIAEHALASWLGSSRASPFGIEVPNGGRAAAWEHYCLVVARHLNEVYRARLSAAQEDASKRTIWRASSFLSRTAALDEGGEEVDWDSVEGLRWPHDVFPMPAAINALLQRHGRSWWIQPAGHDLAAWMPAAKAQYKGVVALTSEYVSTLRWLHKVEKHLPRGWKETLAALSEIVERQDVASDWGTSAGSPERLRTWYALIALLRNALPICRIASKILAGQPIHKLRNTLLETKQYGTLLGGIRSHRGQYLNRSLRRTAESDGTSSAELTALASLLAAPQPTHPEQDRGAYAASRLLQTLRGAARPHCSDGSGQRVRRATAAFSTDLVRDIDDAEGGDWRKKDPSSVVEGSVLAALPSLAATPADYVGLLGDATLLLAQGTQYARYFDGYHLLGAINDMRIENKDTPPEVSTQVVSRVFELFLIGVQGLVAQLAFVLRLAGEAERADLLTHPSIEVTIDAHSTLPTAEELRELLTVGERSPNWAVGVLGIPGSGTVERFCYALPNGEVVPLP